MTWANFDGKPYNQAELAAHIASLDFSHWHRKDGSLGRPLFVTLHNTSEPDLALWLKWGETTRQSYIRNVQDYYEHKLGWAAGPHYFVPPDDNITAFGFSNPVTAGTHCSCFNSDSIGIEMVGEFNREPFDTGPGAVVRDHAVYLMALLHNKLGLDPEHQIYGKRGLHFHIECARDNHDCPGKFVHKQDVVARVKAKMAELSGAPVVVAQPAPPVIAPPAEPAAARQVLFSTSGKMSTFGGPNDTGMTSTEGLALFNNAADMVDCLGGDYVLTAQQAGASGLGRRLNPQKYYIACRWARSEYVVLRHATAWVTANGKTLAARPADWGPNINTGRACDMSPALARDLGLQTDDTVSVVVYADGK